jgi:hypothetical protein
MKRCDWCGIVQRTVPAVLGHVPSKEMRDVNLCTPAIAKLERILREDGTVHITMRGIRTPRGEEFDFNMMEHE